jgi:DNA-directed RNA polymerase subunit RPC12/RpoP
MMTILAMLFVIGLIILVSAALCKSSRWATSSASDHHAANGGSSGEKTLRKNPLVPNFGKYWCYRCKAHLRIDDNFGNNVCVRCDSEMFRPVKVKAWLYGMLGFSLCFLIGALWLEMMFGVDGILGPTILFIICLGSVELWMLNFMNLWWSWSRLQGEKSVEQLDRDGRYYISKWDKAHQHHYS